jgi:quinol monooxygenase YgiN
MPGFVQIIEFQTGRFDEIRELSEQNTSEPTLGLVRGVVTADRERPGTYRLIVEFESYEAAMENSQRPETSEFAGQMAALCDGPPVFYNLDVVHVMEPEPAR